MNWRTTDNLPTLWLWLGVFMVAVQMVVGGITRLTGSGLSITRWEIVTGTVPPLTEAQWEVEFDRYKGTPQYNMINKGMDKAGFKAIYFWEYLHRLWARLMGLVFIIPFGFFLARGLFARKELTRLTVVLMLAGVVASFGWLMVKSGLVDRPWVSPYRLTAHLLLALALYAYLLRTALMRSFPEGPAAPRQALLNVLWLLLWLQLALGGLMSGMRAGLYYPTFPDMAGRLMPDLLLDRANWDLAHFRDHATHGFVIALVQWAHRVVGTLLLVGAVSFYWKNRQHGGAQARTALAIVSVIIIQYTLGVWTVLSCRSGIPVALGAVHQAGGIAVLTVLVVARHRRKVPPVSSSAGGHMVRASG